MPKATAPSETLQGLQLTADAPMHVAVEPYACEIELDTADTLEILFLASRQDDQKVFVDLRKGQVTISCYEPIVKVNSVVLLDLS